MPRGRPRKLKPDTDWMTAEPAAPSRPPGVSVIIPNRSDPWIVQTCRMVLDRTPGAEVIVVQDGWQDDPKLPDGVTVLHPAHAPLGVGPSRDSGILAAANDLCILLDAHMRMPHGWAEAMTAPVLEDRTTIACAVCGVCNDDGGQWGPQTHRNHGARIRYYGSFDGWPMEPGWCRDTGADRERQCVLGACYSLSRQRYLDLGRPWRNAVGWGTSEQLISAVNWFAGGRQWLADTVVEHLYRDKGQASPYSTPQYLAVGRYYNRIRLFDLLPMPQPEREKLSTIIYNAAKGQASGVRSLLEWRDDSAVRDAMAQSGRTWEEYVARWWTEEDLRPPELLAKVQALQAQEARRQAVSFGPAGRPERGPVEVGPADRRWV